MFKNLSRLLLILIVILMLLPLFSCNKDPDPVEPLSIEGHWVDMTGTFAPDWHYHFEDGLMTQYYITAGATLSELSYPYAIRDSTILIGGDATNPPRTWNVYFECADVVRVTQAHAIMGPRFWLKRE